MRITGKQLRRIIQEEVARMINEEEGVLPSMVTGTVTPAPLSPAGAVSVDIPMNQVAMPGKLTPAQMNVRFEENFGSDLKTGAPGVWALEHISGGNIPDTIKDGQASFAVKIDGITNTPPKALKMLGLDIDGASADQQFIDAINKAVPYFRSEINTPADMKALVKFTAVPSAGRGPQRSVRVKSVKFF